ncbi:hypothetical protein XF_0542 [Xylella fastidiosa 9a5c]|uniref:Uncharacterized protein n=1 Tax=Xylella fastidiosa (strain 9a5c) TaxID=160492 RepID=Q9PFW5_XYLFA|nr:hypothetical protein XF_0542 [Xylella fastidiosa 9a5c]
MSCLLQHPSDNDIPIKEHPARNAASNIITSPVTDLHQQLTARPATTVPSSASGLITSCLRQR